MSFRNATLAAIVARSLATTLCMGQRHESPARAVVRRTAAFLFTESN